MSILVENALLSQSAPIAGFGGITLAGTLYRSPGCPGNPFRIFGSYAVVLLVEGRGRYEDANGLRRSVHEGDLLLLFPELGHRYGPGRGGVWSEIYLVFEGPIFDCHRRAGVLRSLDPVRTTPDLDLAFRTLKDVALESTQGLAGQVRACHRLEEWLLSTYGIVPASEVSDAAMELVRGQLDLDLDRPMNTDALSGLTGLSMETIRKRFHAAHGVSPVQYRLRRRIEAAKSLLVTTRLANKEIANYLGFADEFHFSKRFKAVTGCSPRQFRSASGGTE